MTKLSRRNFLFGQLKNVIEPIREITAKIAIFRPPGAVDEVEFIEKCRDCQACLEVCPTHVIQKYDLKLHPAYNTAYLNFNLNSCKYCSDFPCIQACKKEALRFENLKFIGFARINNQCITRHNQYCEICFHSCPEGIDAIVKGTRGRIEIDTEKCVGCGICIKSCFLTPSAIDMMPNSKRT